LLNFKEKTEATANRYTALETNSHVFQNDDGMENIYEKTLGTINKDQEDKMKHIAQNHSITSAT
jgi:hypothetical protein